MKKMAVFGNTAGGKPALAQRLAALTGLPLYVVDMMQFRPGGARVPHDAFLQAHADIFRRDEWIIDGFGNMAIAWERFAATHTLIYVDLPLFIHFRGITKRLTKGLFADPPGWPENSPVWSSSVQSIASSGSATDTSHPSTGSSWRREPHRRGCTT
jgi:adenylate kinase family enzyme